MSGEELEKAETPVFTTASRSNALLRLRALLRRLCALVRNRLPWIVAAAALLCNLIVYQWMKSVCPPHHLCVPNDVGGSPTATTPYIEYSDVTSSASVYRVSGLLKTVKSPYQLVQVYETLFFGKILTIDGALMITERDESNYHESLVHTTLAYLPQARRVLVIGGGDGGTVTQLVRHPNLVEIVWVEIDEVVVQFAKEFFPRQARALQDPRVRLLVQNAATYVQEARYPITGVNNGTFDVILIDSTDFNAAEPLFTASFYADCRALLSPRGILAFNLDSPQWGQVRAIPHCPSTRACPRHSGDRCARRRAHDCRDLRAPSTLSFHTHLSFHATLERRHRASADALGPPDRSEPGGPTIDHRCDLAPCVTRSRTLCWYRYPLTLTHPLFAPSVRTLCWYRYPPAGARGGGLGADDTALPARVRLSSLSAHLRLRPLLLHVRLGRRAPVPRAP